VSVTLRRPVGVVVALRADDLIDFALHQLMHDAETETNAQREQSSLAAPTSSPSASESPQAAATPTPPTS
jgi:hypothetical protein